MGHRWDLSNMVGKALLQLHGKRTPGSQALFHAILITQLKGIPECLKQRFRYIKPIVMFRDRPLHNQTHTWSRCPSAWRRFWRDDLWVCVSFSSVSAPLSPGSLSSAIWAQNSKRLKITRHYQLPWSNGTASSSVAFQCSFTQTSLKMQTEHTLLVKNLEKWATQQLHYMISAYIHAAFLTL